jgi:hypothetical protein
MDLKTALELMTAERDALRATLTAKKPISRTEFDALPPADRTQHIRNGGTVFDAE